MGGGKIMLVGKGSKNYYTTKKKRRKAKIPKQLITNVFKRTFRYFDSYSIDASSVASSYLNFRANGMFDPYAGGGGHQPLGFDQLVGVLYDHYVVLRAKITVTFLSTGATTSGAAICGITILDDNVAPSSNIGTIIEQGRSVTGYVQAYTGMGKTTLRKTCNIGTFLGRKDVMSDPQLKGSVGADPSEQCFFSVFIGATGGNNPDPIVCNVLIEYETALIEPKQLTAS